MAVVGVVKIVVILMLIWMRIIVNTDTMAIFQGGREESKETRIYSLGGHLFCITAALSYWIQCKCDEVG